MKTIKNNEKSIKHMIWVKLIPNLMRKIPIYQKFHENNEKNNENLITPQKT